MSGASRTGNLLQAVCVDEDNRHNMTTCQAYINGATDSHHLIREMYKLDYLYCTPDNVTIGQKVKVVSKYLENHPEQLHELAVGLVYLALNGAFPCEDGQ